MYETGTPGCGMPLHFNLLVVAKIFFFFSFYKQPARIAPVYYHVMKVSLQFATSSLNNSKLNATKT